MGIEDSTHAFSDIKHSTLAEIVKKPEEKPATENKPAENPVPPKEENKRGRILVFKPTGEKVTVLKENVGRSYEGTKIHEVANREGHVFLASDKQLKGLRQ